MNDATFFTAKDGSLTCRYNGIMLHSAYSPQKEAERFVDSQVIPFIPKYIIILEPAIGFCSEYFKKKIPSAKVCAIRFSNEFSKFNNKFDFVFNLFEPDFEARLFNTLGEEGLFSSLFFTWPASAKIFQAEEKVALSKIKKQLNLAQTVLFTHNSFARRWFLNFVNIVSRIEKTQTLKKTNFPIVLCASGPSLQSSVKKLKELENNLFIIAVSSALNVLLKNNLVPDLVISTDGGFWAKKHLYPLKKNKIPLALAIEANLPQILFSELSIIPLIYSDGMESAFIKKTDINYVIVQRNGTVSGTAAELALSLTENLVFMCGLDLEAGCGIQHSQPNILEDENSATDNFFCPKETRISKSRCNSSSLRIYREWFCNLNEKKWQRFFRLSDNYKYSSNLGRIKDANFDFLKENLLKMNYSKSPSAFFSVPRKIDNKKNKEILKSFVLKNENSKEWLKNNFPLDFLLYERCNNFTEKQLLLKKLNEKNKVLIKKIE